MNFLSNKFTCLYPTDYGILSAYILNTTGIQQAIKNKLDINLNHQEKWWVSFQFFLKKS